MMEKNGNTLAPGDPVQVYPGEKTAGASRKSGIVDLVDPDKGLVKVAYGTTTEWVPLDQVVKLP